MLKTNIGIIHRQILGGFFNALNLRFNFYYFYLNMHKSYLYEHGGFSGTVIARLLLIK
jgi:hypothetical protein